MMIAAYLDLCVGCHGNKIQQGQHYIFHPQIGLSNKVMYCIFQIAIGSDFLVVEK